MVNKLLLSRTYGLMDVDDLAADPAWLRVVSEALVATAVLDDDAVLDAHTALAELSAWLGHRRPVQRNQKADWKSLGADVGLALGNLGRGARACLPKLTDLESALQDLFPQAALRSVRQRLSQLADETLAALTAPDTILALWDDFLDAARDEVASSVLRWRSRTLRAVLLALGHDPDAMVRELSGVLLNRKLPVELARFRAGGGEQNEEAWSEPNATAGLTIEQRVSLCRVLLAATPDRADVIVWLLFDHASMSQIVVDVGPIRFLDARWVLARIDTQPLDTSFAPELGNPENLHAFQNLDRDSYAVFARVELRDCLVPSAPGIARSNAEALVELADFHKPGSTWTPRSGYVLFVDGQEVAWHSFTADQPDWRLDVDRTERQLVDLSAKVANRVPLTDPVLRGTTEAISQLKRAVSLPHLDQVFLLVRLLDVARSTVGLDDKGWYSFARSWLRGRWVFRRVRHRLFSLGSHALESPFHGSRGTPSGLESLAQLRERVVRDREWNLRALIKVLPDLAEEYRDMGLQAQELDELADTVSTGERLAHEMATLDEEFATLLSRSRRVRNSIVHGGAVLEATLPSVTSFLRILCIDSFDLVLLALFDGISITDEYHRAKREDIERRSRAEAGSDPADALFGLEPPDDN